MSSATAALATLTPMAPRPMTPSFLPMISVPAKFFFSFSAAFAISAMSLDAFTHSIPPTTSLAANSIPAITSSFTPLALAPGVLNTTTPCSAHLSRGILLTPAPALATARSFSGISISCMDALLTNMPSASFTSFVISYCSLKFSSPT